MNHLPVHPDLEEMLEHAGWLRTLAARLVAGQHDADDLVQDVWRATLPARGGEVREPRAWLAGALRNVWRMRNRGDARRSRRECAGASPVEVPSAADLASEQDLRRSLLEHVDALPDGERDVVLLRFWQDLPPREVAKQLGVPVNTVRSRTARALQRLRERLDDQHGDRRAWCLAFVPLLDVRSLRVAAGVGGPTGPARGLLRVAATATAAAVAVAGYVGYRTWTAPTIDDLARWTPASEVFARFAEPDASPPFSAARQKAPVGLRDFVGRVVDLEGRHRRRNLVPARPPGRQHDHRRR